MHRVETALSHRLAIRLASFKRRLARGQLDLTRLVVGGILMGLKLDVKNREIVENAMFSQISRLTGEDLSLETRLARKAEDYEAKEQRHFGKMTREELMARDKKLAEAFRKLLKSGG